MTLTWIVLSSVICQTAVDIAESELKPLNAMSGTSAETVEGRSAFSLVQPRWSEELAIQQPCFILAETARAR